jgi:1,4-dihydroxy-2-naphthoyl-CoA synthase
MCIARNVGRVQAPDRGAQASRPDFAAELIVLSAHFEHLAGLRGSVKRDAAACVYPCWQHKPVAQNEIRLAQDEPPGATIGMMNGLAYGGAAVLASSLDMRVGCEGCKFRFLAAAYGRINSTWTLPNQVGWPIAKELLFTARVVGAEEAYRIGLLNHLVPRAQLRAKTMELAKMIAANHRGAVMGVKALMLQQMGQGLEEQFNAEHEYTTHVLRGAKAKDAFPDFITRKGLAS